MEKEKLKSSIAWTVTAIIALIVMIAAVAYENRNAIKNYFIGENQEVVQDTVSYEEPVLTIQEYVKLREQMREDRRIDSVFLTMPDVILIDILRQHGTDLSISDIVYIYESNKTIYNKVLSGARSQQYLEDSIQKVYKDSVIAVIQHEPE